MLGLTTKVVVEETHSLPYTCANCQKLGTATVRADGTGYALVVGQSRARADARATVLAQRNALWRAERVVPLLACPSCQYAPVKSQRRFWRSLAIDGAIIGALVAVSAVSAFPSPYRWLGFLGGAIFGWLSFSDARQRWRAVVASSTVSTVAPPRPARPLPSSSTGLGDTALPLIFIGVIAALSLGFIARGYFGLDNDASVQVVQFIVATVALAVLLWGQRLARHRMPGERILLRDRMWAAIGVVAVVGFFNFAHFHFNLFVHVWDTYHYVMGAKYFNEVGYERLYDCAAVVDFENGRADELRRRKVTNLRDNFLVQAYDVGSNPKPCKDAFTPARWAEFTRDVNAFRGMVNEGRWREIHLDHGFNATPVWALAGHALVNDMPVTLEKLRIVDSIDTLYVLAAAAIVWWAFGFRGFAAAGITLGLNFANRYYWTGGSFLRYDWLFYLVASVCLLKKGYPFLGGASIAYSTLLRLFPGLLVLGPLLAAVVYFRKNRSVAREFVRYVAGGTVTTIVLVGATFVFFGGAPTWKAFTHNTVKHASTPLSNHMGLRTVLSYRNADTMQRTQDNSLPDWYQPWKQARIRNFHQLLPLFAVLLLFAAFMVYQALSASGTQLWFASALATGFIVFGAELTNYYYCFLMGLAVLHVKRREVGILLTVFALLCLIINWGSVVWMSRWLDEQYVSMSIAALFAVVGTWLLFTKWGVATATLDEPEPRLVLAAVPAAVASSEKPLTPTKTTSRKRRKSSRAQRGS